MPLITFNDMMADLKAKKYYPIYFLMGEEDYFIDEVTDYIAKNVLKEEERDFNQSIFYGNDITLPNIIVETRQYPMIAERRVIIVKEAQNVKGIDGSDSDKESAWLNYATNPIPTTILVIAYRARPIDKRKKLYKSLEKNGAILESSRLYESKMPEWIISYVKSKGYDIQTAAAQILVSHLGNDLSKVTNGLSKLMTLLPEGTAINSQHIEDNIGISKEYNIFELNKAIGLRDTTKAFTIVAHFAKNPKNNPLPLVIRQLFNYFLKILMIHTTYRSLGRQELANALSINAYFISEYIEAARNYPKAKVEKIISYLRHYDAYSKGVNDSGTEDGELMKELITLIMV